MRKFGKDKPELMSFQYGDSDKVYTLPLAASCPADLILEMNEAFKSGELEAFAWQKGFIEKYNKDLKGKLTGGDIKDIFDAWTEESSVQGADVGESSASSEPSKSTDEH